MADSQPLSVEIQLVGLDDVIARLYALPTALARGPIRKALFAPAKKMRDDVQNAAPVWKGNRFGPNDVSVPGLLKKSIGVFRDRRPENPMSEVYYIGTRRLTRTYANTTSNRRKKRVGKKYRIEGAGYYVKFVEFGTNTTGLGRPGQKAQRFFTHVYESEKESAVTLFTDTLAPELDATVRKLAQTPGGYV
jgi:HK97 gp10 family phage protein